MNLITFSPEEKTENGEWADVGSGTARGREDAAEEAGEDEDDGVPLVEVRNRVVGRSLMLSVENIMNKNLEKILPKIVLHLGQDSQNFGRQIGNLFITSGLLDLNTLSYLIMYNYKLQLWLTWPYIT